MYDVNTQQKVLTHEVFQCERVHGIITAKPEDNGEGSYEKITIFLAFWQNQVMGAPFDSHYIAFIMQQHQWMRYVECLVENLAASSDSRRNVPSGGNSWSVTAF